MQRRDEYLFYLYATGGLASEVEVSVALNIGLLDCLCSLAALCASALPGPPALPHLLYAKLAMSCPNLPEGVPFTGRSHPAPKPQASAP